MNKKIQDVLQEKSSGLEMILAKAGSLQKLQSQVLKTLPEDLRAHVVVGGYSGQSLVLITDTPTWATKCRFLAPSILNDLKKVEWLSTLAEIKVKTGFMEKPVELTEEKTVIQKNATPPPESVRRQFEQMAAHEENPTLKKILLKLSQKGSP
ncbi:MAG: hypothetical protein CMF48_05505 [Legionellales bacterium]|nr:hypothetical protein [Legionellales bacterium]|tara:strand:- start:209 stop:664 length:456 start_codon:yes stop_codon:yes gene_type:complete